MSAPVRVYFEVGKVWTFAAASDWPGWCRRAKGEQAAADALIAYAPRYAAIAGLGWSPGDLEVVGRVQGDATTDFGAPSVVGPLDDEPLDPSEALRLAGLLERTWSVFDDVVASAPAVLRKGPRGGGRDRDAVVAHVQEAERSYGRKFGVRAPPRTPWPEQRRSIVDAITSGEMEGSWPLRYAVRRVAWHVTDHAWEIQDRSSSRGEGAVG